jgi:hypothetical protein
MPTKMDQVEVGGLGGLGSSSDLTMRQRLAVTERAPVAPLADGVPPAATGGAGASAGAGVGGAAMRKMTKGYWEVFCDRVLRGLVKPICIVSTLRTAIAAGSTWRQTNSSSSAPTAPWTPALLRKRGAASWSSTPTQCASGWKRSASTPGTDRVTEGMERMEASCRSTAPRASVWCR